MPPKKSPSSVFQIKVTLAQTKPPVWRRFLIRSNARLSELHVCIQIVMGWYNSHLHEFSIYDREYGMTADTELGHLNENRYTLNKLVGPGSKFQYTYDFGDNWNHKITIEKELPAEPGTKYPICTAGKNACPPEDCGGPWVYPDFLAAVANPQHPDHEDMIEWIGGKFDPSAFDLDALNARLRVWE